MIQYPLTFQGETVSTAGIANAWKSKASEYELDIDIPKEFEGKGSALSPEDLYLLAIQNCFVATFKVYAEYSRLEFDRVTVDSILTVDKNESGKPVMKKVKLSIAITNPNNATKAKTLVNKVIDNGFILQSIKSEVEFDLEIL